MMARYSIDLSRLVEIMQSRGLSVRLHPPDRYTVLLELEGVLTPAQEQELQNWIFGLNGAIRIDPTTREITDVVRYVTKVD